MTLTEIFSELNETKNVDKVTFTRILHEVFKNAIIKQYGSDENFDIIINIQSGDLEIWHKRIIVSDEEFTNPNTQISLSEVQKIDPDYQEGEEYSEPIDLRKFERRVIMSLRQNLINKINQLEKENFYTKYKDKEGTIVTGEVYQVSKNEIIVKDEDGFELILPKKEMIPNDKFRKGDTLKAIIQKVDVRNNNPLVILSRTSNNFLRKLFELEVPEIEDGLITIVDIVRIPGERAKISVEAYDERIDAVGACIGMKGARIQGITREVRNENIDVINYTSNTSLYIQRALAPAKIEEIKLFEEEKRAEVYMVPEEVAKAIGKKGYNIKLAMELTKYQIDVYRIIDDEEEKDIMLEDLKDEIDEWIINEFKKVGIDTAQAVIEHDIDMLSEITDLEVETLQYVIETIKKHIEQ